MKKRNIIISVIMIVALLSSLCGCGQKQEDNNTGVTKITWWETNALSAVVDSYDEVAAMQKLQEKFGVDIEFIHPTSAGEQFNTMMAAGDMKDIVKYDWNVFSGGPVNAAKQGAIATLNDYMDEYMPNISALAKKDSLFNYQIRGYDSNVYVIPSYTDSLITESSFGPQIRKDWLDKLGLELPKTFDDWYIVLKAFKTQDPNGNGQADEMPFVDNSAATFLYMSSAFNGANQDFYIKDGKVVFGFAEPEYKEFLKIMNKWYSEGLIDKEYNVKQGADSSALMLSDKGGAFIGYCGSAMSKYMAGGRETNPDYTLVAVQWPVLNAGDTVYAGYQYQNKPASSGKGWAFSKKNKNLQKTLQMIDYLYGEEGSTLFNWGIEGESYTVGESGEKQYTDIILKNPEGKTPIESICNYAFTQYPIGIKSSEAYMQLNTQFPQQAEAMKLWYQADVSKMIPSLAVSPEGQKAITDVMDDIYTYRSEWLHKFVTGVESLDKFDEVSATIHKMGIDKACGAYQEAYDKYMNN